jgi:hypothetical protein
MLKTNRGIKDLLLDYAGALRDGHVPIFLKSITPREAQRLASSPGFWNATEVVQVLNNVALADKAVIPNVNLFISRVDAEIASRLKKEDTVKK